MKRTSIIWLILWCSGLICLPAVGERAASQPAGIIRGTIPARYHRPLKPEKNGELKKLLKRFETPAEDFSYKKRLVRETEKYEVWQITFPSPYVSPDPCNNLVWGEYYRAKVKGARAGAVVLHPMDQRVDFVREACEIIANNGMDCVWIRMAYFGERADRNPMKQFALLQDVDTLVSSVCQSVMDIRRATEFLSAQPEVEREKIFLCGCSLGALMGSLTMGVDGHYARAVLLLGGCNLPRIIAFNQWAAQTLAMFNKELDVSPEGLTAALKPIEPLTYISRASETEVLMINVRDDQVIPPETSRELASRLTKVDCRWYDGGHCSLPMPEVNKQVLVFLKKK